MALMDGSLRRFERELRQRSKEACDRLEVEITRSTQNARRRLAWLAKEGNPSEEKTRICVAELIQNHNHTDVFKHLLESASVVRHQTSRLTSLKSIPKDAGLVSAIVNMVHGATRLNLPETNSMSALFQRMYGERFASWARENVGNIASENIFSKLSQPIQQQLVDDYIAAIIQPQTLQRKIGEKNTKHCDNRQSKHNIQLQKPRLPPKTIQQCPKHPATRCTLEDDASLSTAVSISKVAPALPIRIIRPNPKLEVAFDVRTRNPLYVMERLDGKARSKPTVRHPFYEEQRIPPEYRNRLSAFLRTGYDRGHMAPAADFGEETVRDTFNLCNISPQEKSMNRSVWAKLERWCRSVAQKEIFDNAVTHSAVFIVTGPAWLPTSPSDAPIAHQFEFQAIGRGDCLVHVPTHFFKIVVVSERQKISKFASFLVPNVSPKADSILEDYMVPWTRLETITGLQYFPNQIDPQHKRKSCLCMESFLSNRKPPSASKGAVKSLVSQMSKVHIR